MGNHLARFGEHLIESALVNGSPPFTRLLPQPDRVTLDPIYYYGKSLYRDVDFRYFFRSIFSRILSGGKKKKTRERKNKTEGKEKKTRGRNHKVDLRLGRCIIHHFPKRTFIHVFFFPV